MPRPRWRSAASSSSAAHGWLTARKLGDIAIATAAQESCLARHGTPRDARELLPVLDIPPLPCGLAVQRAIRGDPVVRRGYDFLAAAISRSR
ncbi:MAG: hypothetical protein KGN16_06590 [Burkholderiales bacterium]|nr:hypothetical protein [Burkholderiales bacterium]